MDVSAYDEPRTLDGFRLILFRVRASGAGILRRTTDGDNGGGGERGESKVMDTRQR